VCGARTLSRYPELTRPLARGPSAPFTRRRTSPEAVQSFGSRRPIGGYSCALLASLFLGSHRSSASHSPGPAAKILLLPRQARAKSTGAWGARPARRLSIRLDKRRREGAGQGGLRARAANPEPEPARLVLTRPFISRFPSLDPQNVDDSVVSVTARGHVLSQVAGAVQRQR
jgi:hypothetical protein